MLLDEYAECMPDGYEDPADSIALKEADETEYWLDLLHETKYLDDKIILMITVKEIVFDIYFTKKFIFTIAV